MRSTLEYSCSTGFLYQLVDKAHPYILLVKPRIVLLVTVTGLSAMVIEGSLLTAPLRFAAVLLGIILAAGAAGALNQYYDRDIDAIMARTRTKRPIPAGKIAPRSALWFGLLTGILSLGLLQAAGNALAAALGLGTMAVYVIVYTIWLKRKTSVNIVIGGTAGAATPLIGWAAGAGDLSLVPWLMFLVIFLWTPPHFWSLALYTKNEYARAGIPMLPVVAGELVTCRHITAYCALLLPATACLGIVADLGSLYLSGTTLLGLNMIRRMIVLGIKKNSRSAQTFFAYSNIYLAAVFILVLASRW
jgi:heme o synthase